MSRFPHLVWAFLFHWFLPKAFVLCWIGIELCLLGYTESFGQGRILLGTAVSEPIECRKCLSKRQFSVGGIALPRALKPDAQLDAWSGKQARVLVREYVHRNIFGSTIEFDLSELYIDDKLVISQAEAVRHATQHRKGFRISHLLAQAAFLLFLCALAVHHYLITERQKGEEPLATAERLRYRKFLESPSDWTYMCLGVGSFVQLFFVSGTIEDYLTCIGIVMTLSSVLALRAEMASHPDVEGTR